VDDSPACYEEREEHLEIILVPARWWQAIPFVCLNLEIVRGIDPMADRLLSRPWRLSNLLERAYMLGIFFQSNAQFITIAGKRAGVLWTISRSEFLFILSFGLLPHFRVRGIGVKVALLLKDYCNHQRFKAAAAKIAASNHPIQRVVRAFDGQPLGLATTSLTISTTRLTSPTPHDFEIRPLNKPDGIRAWRHWKYQTVEQVAGHIGVDVAKGLMDTFDWLESPPRGEYLALYQDGHEIGFAFARQHRGESKLGLFPDHTFWSDLQTAKLVGALTSYLDSPVRYLTLTQAHADALTPSTLCEFERHQEQDRYFVFWLYPFSFRGKFD